MSKKWTPEPLFDPVDSLVLGMERLGKTKTKKKKYLTFLIRMLYLVCILIGRLNTAIVLMKSFQDYKIKLTLSE